jgi:putative transposase
MPVRRRNTRLGRDNYVGLRTYFVTICCDRRVPHLQEPSIASRIMALLIGCAVRYSFQLHAFCLMPDHVHILAEGTRDDCDLLEFIRVFKLRTAFEFRKSHRCRLWEMSYYDHILQPSDSIEQVAAYVWWNPVRKGLCARPGDFPYSGSQTVDWIQRSGRPLDRSPSLPWADDGPV